MSYDPNARRICEQDEQYLLDRAVPLTVAQAAGLHSADDQRAAQELGFARPLVGGALVIPYFDAAGKQVSARARLHSPTPGGPKFLTPAKSEVRPYFPPVVDAALWKDRTIHLIVAEGAIKALGMSASGIPTIGLGGVLAGGHDPVEWREKKNARAHPDIIERVNLNGRKVTIVFDAGRASNPLVALGEAINAAGLAACGADVWVAALPFREDGRDQGPDDYLQMHGVDALWGVIDCAKPADPLKRIQSLAQIPEAERQAVVRDLMTDLPFLASLRVGGDRAIDSVSDELAKLGVRIKTELSRRVRAFRDQLRSKADPPKKPSRSGATRPQILITVEEMEVVDQAEAAIAADPDIFKRGNALVRVCTDEAGPKFLVRERGTPRVEVVPNSTLGEHLSAYAEWVREDETGDFVPARPPTWAVKALADRPDWPNVRPIISVAESPVFRRDGRVIYEPGYDPDTGLLMLLVGEVAHIPDQPTKADAQEACQLLLDLVADFPFSGEEHRAAWLSALLTLFAMSAYSGCAPLVVIDANVRGSGKTLLVEILGIIATGRSVPRMANTVDDAEMRKRLLSLALAASQVVLIDNIAGKFGTPSLDMAITAGSVQDRVLGLSKIVAVPLRPLWLATGNNVQLQGDLGRRVLHIRLESPLEKPEERSGFKQPDLAQHVREQRPKLVAAVLTILRAYHLAGRPPPNTRPWGSFEAWQALVCGAVTWLGLPDPTETRQGLATSDSEGGEVAALIAGWAELDPHGHGVTAAEAVRLLEVHPQKFSTLRDALSELAPSKSGSSPDARALGYQLRKFRGRVVGGRKLELRTGHQSTAKWYVAKIGRPSTAGDHGGDGGDDVPATDRCVERDSTQAAVLAAQPQRDGSPPSPPSPPASRFDGTDEEIPF